MADKYFYEKLQIVIPDFNSELTSKIIELDHLRQKTLGGSTYPGIFFQLKTIFQYLESLESARIEGNRTTLAELIEDKMNSKKSKTDSMVEIRNLETAMRFIDECVEKVPIDKAFIREIHRKVVSNLPPENEGDATPGVFRLSKVSIQKSNHIPPDYTQVDSYIEELFGFISEPHAQKYDLLKIALVHHRFMWIHPFTNGNGRVGRLLTYAMLVKLGFNIKVGRILNPTAIFCNNREKYYDFLSRADSGLKDDLLAWCEYVLIGLKTEIEKIDALLDHEYLSAQILKPAVEVSLERKIITPVEAKILNVAIEKQIFQAGDLKDILPGKIPAEISRIIRSLKDKKMLLSPKSAKRKYYINFSSSFLLRSIILMLKKHDFIPLQDSAT